MPTYDPLNFTSWVQIAALLIIVAGILAWRWLATFKAKQAETAAKVDAVQATLQPNGGASLKDQTNRMEGMLTDLVKAQAADSQKLADHITWSEGYVKETSERIDGLACQARVGHRYLDNIEPKG